MKSILIQGRIPENLHVDQGSKFYTSNFKPLMREYDINLYSTYSNSKASMVERFNRTLKTWMFKKFILRGNYKWIDILPDLIKSIMKKIYRTIG